MKSRTNEVIEKVQSLENIDSQEKNAMVEKLNEWQTDSSAESNSLAMFFEKFWIELEPIFAELGLV